MGAVILSAAARLTQSWKPGHPAFLLLRHLRVDDAAAGGHPLDAAGLEQADVADAVAVAHAPLEHDRHRLEAAVRMIGKAADVVARRIAAERIEHQERIEPLLQGLRQHADELDAVAVRGGLAAHDALHRARAESGLERGGCSSGQCSDGGARVNGAVVATLPSIGANDRPGRRAVPFSPFLF